VFEAIANELGIQLLVDRRGDLYLDPVQGIEWLAQEEAVILPRLHDAALGQQVEGGPDRRPRNADQIRKVLLAKMMPRFQFGVPDDIQNLVGEAKAALLG
jgi:hypothetical protein